MTSTPCQNAALDRILDRIVAFFSIIIETIVANAGNVRTTLRAVMMDLPGGSEARIEALPAEPTAPHDAAGCMLLADKCWTGAGEANGDDRGEKPMDHEEPEAH